MLLLPTCAPPKLLLRQWQQGQLRLQSFWLRKHAAAACIKQAKAFQGGIRVRGLRVQAVPVFWLLLLLLPPLLPALLLLEEQRLAGSGEHCPHPPAAPCSLRCSGSRAVSPGFRCQRARMALTG